MALKILEIEKASKDFYAPAAQVLVGGQDVVRDLYLELTSVQVDQTLEGADRFSFVINNGFDVSKREFICVGNKSLPEFFKPGAVVAIHMGYGDQLDLMLNGIVTELQTSFPSSGLPQLTVSGYDYMFCLTKGTDSKKYEKKKDSDVVRLIANEYGLTHREVQDTEGIQPAIERSQESAARFLKRLAERNGFEIFVTEKKELFFRKPANDKTGAIELEWGRGLLSFSPELNLSEQVTQVEVHGWNIQTKKPIVGKARPGDVPGRDANKSSGAEYLEKVCKKKQATLRIREPVFSQQEADKRAVAILKRRAEGFVGGRGESLGIPELQPNVNIKLGGLGKFFDTTFYVQQTTHTVDSSGYRTSFQVKDVTI